MSNQWSLGYWTPFGNPPLPVSAIDWAALTHIVYSAALVNADGTLDLTSQEITSQAPAMIAAAHPNVKVLLSLQQRYWPPFNDTTSFHLAAENHRAAFVASIMNAVNTYGFDGVDIDWEPFNPAVNGAAMQLLASDLRTALGSKLLTAPCIVTHSAFWGTVHGYFDKLGIMTYDVSGPWDPYTWHSDALYGPADDAVWSVDLARRRFTAQGIPVSKLMLGIAFEGWKWTGGGITGPGQTWTSTPSLQQIYYQQTQASINAGNYRRDESAKAPYLTGPSFFWSYDDEWSVAEKVHYAQNQNMGGWIIWVLWGDYFPTQTPNQPLLTAIKTAMGGGGSVFTATFLGNTGEDKVGTITVGPDGVPDWHIHLTGLQGTPTHIRITAGPNGQFGVWEIPYNGVNWIIVPEYDGQGNADLWIQSYTHTPDHIRVDITVTQEADL